MTTNRDWLFSLPLEEQYAWMNAEHQERALDGDTAVLEAKIAELTEQLEAAYAKNRSLRLHISNMQEGRNGWHIKGKELQKQVGELTAERDKLQEQLLIGWECECRLQAERERYRSKFGKCLDYADAIHALMDDEGMA